MSNGRERLVLRLTGDGAGVILAQLQKDGMFAHASTEGRRRLDVVRLALCAAGSGPLHELCCSRPDVSPRQERSVCLYTEFMTEAVAQFLEHLGLCMFPAAPASETPDSTSSTPHTLRRPCRTTTLQAGSFEAQAQTLRRHLTQAHSLSDADMHAAAFRPSTRSSGVLAQRTIAVGRPHALCDDAPHHPRAAAQEEARRTPGPWACENFLSRRLPPIFTASRRPFLAVAPRRP